MVVLAAVCHLNRHRPEGLEKSDMFLSETFGQAPFTVIAVLVGVASGVLALAVLSLLVVTGEVRRPGVAARPVHRPCAVSGG